MGDPQAEGKKGRSSSITEALGLGPREIISLVGGGGKTTLMFRAAREILTAGKTVLTTTTTRILEPEPGDTCWLVVERDEEKMLESIRNRLKEYRHITAVSERLEGKKLKGISPALVFRLWNETQVDYIIVEADGAAGRPLKAPREWEPVYPEGTTLVVAIAGVDAIGMQLCDASVFQPELVSTLIGVPTGERISTNAIARLITHRGGTFKGAPSSARVVVLLNKVDCLEDLSVAEDLKDRIMERKHPRIERIVLAHLRCDPPVLNVFFPQGRQ